MTEVILIMNQKGGVGKTTTAISLAAGYGFMGKKVLAIDIDPQGHLSKYSDVVRKDKATILELLDGSASFEETVQRVSFGDILPSDSYLSTYLVKLISKPSAPFVIRNLLKPLREVYDYIIIDSSPAVNQLTVAAMVAADKIIIPTEAEYFSADGATVLLATLKEVQECFNASLQIEGFLVIKYRARLKETKMMIELLETLAKDYFNTKVFKTKIRNAIALPQSQRLKKSIFEFDPQGNPSQDYLELIKELGA